MRKGSRRGPSHLCACRLALLAALALGTSVAIAAPGPSIRYSPERIDVALELDAPALTEVREADGGRYVDVALDGHPSRAHPGEPALPVVEIWLETPRRSPRPHVWLEDARWEDAVLSAPVRPAREPVPKTPGELARRRFVRDESFYRGGGLRNPWAERLSTWYRLTPVRRSKVDYFRLELFLHRFDPEALRLRFPRRIEVSIGWRGGPAASRAYAARGAGETRILEVDLTGDHALPALVKAGYDIAGRRGSEVTIYATAKEESALREAGFEVRRLPNEAPRKARDLRSKGSKDDPPGVYRTPEQVGEFL
ncbi:MAG: hypothetical protein JXA90_03620, partial [Planctomycetes bacterium]|nr:hypothetical protein [Planctomycetota bacterium]